jgi:hypothetical protein
MTNLEIITAALRLLGVIAETETPSAEQGATGLAVLNDMLEDWSGREIEVGQWPQTELDAEFPGESNIEGFDNKIICTSFSFGAHQPIDYSRNATRTGGTARSFPGKRTGRPGGTGVDMG